MHELLKDEKIKKIKMVKRGKIVIHKKNRYFKYMNIEFLTKKWWYDTINIKKIEWYDKYQYFQIWHNIIVALSIYRIWKTKAWDCCDPWEWEPYYMKLEQLSIIPNKLSLHYKNRNNNKDKVWSFETWS